MGHKMYLERNVVVDSQMIESKESPTKNPKQMATAVATKGDDMFELLHDLIIDETGNKTISAQNSFLHKRLIGEWSDDIMLNNIMYFRLKHSLPQHKGAFAFEPIDQTLTWSQLVQIGSFLQSMKQQDIKDSCFSDHREELLEIIKNEQMWRETKELDERLQDSTVNIHYRYWTTET